MKGKIFMSRILETENLTIQFGGLRAVDELTFGIDQGEIVGLIGPNGSGKTTFFNVISGIYRPTSGKVLFNNENIVGMQPFEINRKGMARSFQNSRLFSNLSVLDNVIIGMHHNQRSQWYHAIFSNHISKMELLESSQKATELLSYFSKELAEDRYKRAADLPQAHKRKLEICRALASDPILLLLDEPSAGMDPEETYNLMLDIQKIQGRNKNMGIIIIEHDMLVIRGVAQRVVVLNYGRKIAEGTFEEISNKEEVLEAYLGREEEHATS